MRNRGRNEKQRKRRDIEQEERNEQNEGQAWKGNKKNKGKNEIKPRAKTVRDGSNTYHDMTPCRIAMIRPNTTSSRKNLDFQGARALLLQGFVIYHPFMHHPPTPQALFWEKRAQC